MARRSFNPKDYGIDMERENFLDMLVDEFNDFTRGQLTVDEMLLRPRMALQFCDTIRLRRGLFDLPDDIILAAIMTRRKSPG